MLTPHTLPTDFNNDKDSPKKWVIIIVSILITNILTANLPTIHYQQPCRRGVVEYE